MGGLEWDKNVNLRMRFASFTKPPLFGSYPEFLLFSNCNCNGEERCERSKIRPIFALACLGPHSPKDSFSVVNSVGHLPYLQKTYSSVSNWWPSHSSTFESFKPPQLRGQMPRFSLTTTPAIPSHFQPRLAVSRGPGITRQKIRSVPTTSLRAFSPQRASNQKQAIDRRVTAKSVPNEPVQGE